MFQAVVLVAITLSSENPADLDVSGNEARKDVSQENVVGNRKKPDYGAPEFDVGVETATHEEVDPLPVEFESLTSLRLDTHGNLLACDSGAQLIKVVAHDGTVRSTLPLEFGPEAIDVAPDGTIYCGGQGRLAHLAGSGEVLHTADSPTDVETEGAKRRKQKRPTRLSGIAVGRNHVFVAFGSGGGTGSKSVLFRFDRDLQNPTLLAEGLRGCCQRCDIATVGSALFLAENGAHRVVTYDSDGEVLQKWGERSRTGLEGFGSCCNPMNLCFDTNGVLFTAESGLGRVKRYSTEGKYLGLVGYVGTARYTRASGMATTCSNIAIDVTPDGKTVYVMDFRNKVIRVLRRKK